MFETMYNKGASFNVYMFHGGTNFELWNGAEYEAGVSSWEKENDLKAICTKILI